MQRRSDTGHVVSVSALQGGCGCSGMSRWKVSPAASEARESPSRCQPPHAFTYLEKLLTQAAGRGPQLNALGTGTVTCVLHTAGRSAAAASHTAPLRCGLSTGHRPGVVTMRRCNVAGIVWWWGRSFLRGVHHNNTLRVAGCAQRYMQSRSSDFAGWAVQGRNQLSPQPVICRTNAGTLQMADAGRESTAAQHTSQIACQAQHTAKISAENPW